MAQTETASHCVDGAKSPSPPELSVPVFKNGKYDNPWDTWKKATFTNFLSFAMNRENAKIPDAEDLERELPVLKPNLQEFSQSPQDGIRAMWIGHASVLVQMDGVTILTDPVFSSRCSPVSFMGPKRIRPAPCSIAELPKVDIVVISHNHYDHLDYSSVVELNRRQGQGLHWYVPMGLRQWMLDSGCRNVVERTWWEESCLPSLPSIRIACTPTQHWSQRSVTNTNKTLWCSWAVMGPKHSFYFGGDTGYCAGFPQIGRKYGPFSLAAIPIGCYKPRWFLSPQHVDPAEAVQIHKDIGAKNSIAIHWGTFNMMAYEQCWEPRATLAEEVSKAGLQPKSFITLKHGEIKVFSNRGPE